MVLIWQGKVADLERELALLQAARAEVTAQLTKVTGELDSLKVECKQLTEAPLPPLSSTLQTEGACTHSYGSAFCYDLVFLCAPVSPEDGQVDAS